MDYFQNEYLQLLLFVVKLRVMEHRNSERMCLCHEGQVVSAGKGIAREGVQASRLWILMDSQYKYLVWLLQVCISTLYFCRYGTDT